MDFLDVLEVVSAVLWKLKAQPYVDPEFIQGAITEAEAAVARDLGGNIYYYCLTYDHESLRKLLDAVYKMEYYAETFNLSTRRRSLRRMGFGRMLNLKATDDIGSLSPRRLLSDIDDAIKPLMNINESGVVIGLEEDKGNMVTWLTDTNSRPNLGFILISGQTGSGKTTLATEIYKSREIADHFKSSRAWVSASEDSVSNLRSILREITGASTVDMESTVPELEEMICEILQKKRRLVVVDNVQSPYLFKTRQGSALSDEGNGSRVIMTMRSKDLIQHFVDEHPSLSYELQPLQDEHAWHLFLKKVRLPDNVASPDLDMHKSKIVAICQGIPSAIVVLGRFLSTKKRFEEWLPVLEHPIDGNGVSVSTILALMHSDLTFGLRPCLLYFGFFPKGYEIPVRRLLRLWLAEGLIVTDNPNPEEIAERTLIYFIIKGIIEIGELRKDGNPKTCRMTGIVHDICSSKAEDIGLVYIGRTISDEHKTAASSRIGVRGLADDDGDIKDYHRQDSYIRHLRSYLSFYNQKKDAPAMEIGNFLSKVLGFGLLKVLDLEGVYKPKLPHNLGKLYQLRYLGLRRTFLDTLPHSVSELSYLETLDLKHTYISSLPNSIWNMEYLLHLCHNDRRLDLSAASVSLTKLHTLSGFFVDNKIPVKSGFDRSTNLRKLSLTVFHLDSFEELNKWIAGLKELKSLKLRSKKEYGKPWKLALKPLSGLENLESLYLLGELPEIHNHYFPRRLEVLTLSVSHLKEDPMPILGQLPLLSALRLLANSYTGMEIVCQNGSFQSLKILELWMLKELETWTVEEGAMQNLEDLEIRCCHNLRELPDNLDLSHIENIKLTNMQNEFVDNVRAEIPEENSSILETQQLRDVLCQYCQDNLNQV